MNSIIKVGFKIVLIYFIIYTSCIKTQADNSGVNVIYSESSLSQNQEFSISISTKNITNIQSAQIYLKYDENLFEPVFNDNNYFFLSSNNIFKKDEILVCDKIDTTIRFISFKKQKEDLNLYQNTISKFKFTAKTNIYDLKSTLNSEAFSLKIYLFDFNNLEITTSMSFLEEMKVTWDINNYEIEVNSELPLFENDIKVLNRKTGEYHIDIFDDEVINNELGNKIIKVSIIDYLNSTIVYLGKNINIIDATKPIITLEKSCVTFTDQELDKLAYNYAQINDNYDKAIQLEKKYYDNNNILIDNYDLFIEYLKHNNNAYIEYYGCDSSNNEAISVKQEVQIIDTMPPIVRIRDDLLEIEINDIDIDAFDLKNVFIIEDAYDDNPKLILSYEQSTEFPNYKELLMKNQELVISYFANDTTNNQTETFNILLKITDTIPPTITTNSNIMIYDYELITIKNDTLLLTELFNKYVNVKDNFDNSCSIRLYYYDDKQNALLPEEFSEYILQGNTGVIYYQALDKSGNSSEKVNSVIMVTDTIAPKIIVNNISNNQKYFSVEKIDYQVDDYNTKDLVIKITLNGIDYDNTTISTLGDYELVLTAIDKSGNMAQEVINFSIIKNNFIGCGDDFECYTRNYTNIVIAGAVIIGIAALIATYRIIVWVKKHPRNHIRE